MQHICRKEVAAPGCPLDLHTVGASLDCRKGRCSACKHPQRCFALVKRASLAALILSSVFFSEGDNPLALGQLVQPMWPPVPLLFSITEILVLQYF